MRIEHPRTAPESLMDETMACLHAPDDLADRAIAAAGGARRRHGHTHRLATVAGLALAASLAFGGTAYAVVNSLFFAQAYGDHGLGASKTWSMTGDDGTSVYSYKQSYQTIADDDVTQAIEDATEPVNLSASANGYTLTIESMVLDANGAGAATFTLTSSDAFKLVDSGVGSELVFDQDSNLNSIGMVFSSGDFGDSLDSSVHYDIDTSTNTELHGTMYFNSKGLDSFDGGITWKLQGFSGGDRETSTPFEASTGTFKPSKVVGAKSYADDTGNTASLSPLSLKVGYRLGEAKHSYSAYSVLLNQADGTQQPIIKNMYQEGETAETNYYVYYGWESDGTAYEILSLTQATNPDVIENITLEGKAHFKDGRPSEPYSYTLLPVE